MQVLAKAKAQPRRPSRSGVSQVLSQVGRETFELWSGDGSFQGSNRFRVLSSNRSPSKPLGCNV